MSAVYFGDVANTAVSGQSRAPAAAISTATTTNGTGVDLLTGDGNNFVAILNMGTYDVASGNETYAISITESDDNSTFVACTPAVAFTSKTAAGGSDGVAYMEIITGKRSKRYVRAEIVTGGTSPNCIPVVTILERKRITGSGAGYQA